MIELLVCLKYIEGTEDSLQFHGPDQIYRFGGSCRNGRGHTQRNQTVLALIFLVVQGITCIVSGPHHGNTNLQIQPV